ncbi:hypothetical protein Peur_020512 [Populus x canadensis]
MLCYLNSVRALSRLSLTVRWNRYQGAVVNLSEHSIVLIVEETCCLQAKVYLQKEIKTRIPDTISGDYNFEPAGSTPLSFTVKIFYSLCQ